MRAKRVNSTRTPIYRDAGFLLGDIPTMKQAFADEHNHPHSPNSYIYSRYRNPNVVAAEEMIMEMENAQWSLLTQSGMAAIDVALSVFQTKENTGKWLFFTEIYGGTNSFIDKVLINRRGIDIIRFAPEGDDYSLEHYVNMLETHKPSVVFFEAISNPMLITVDGAEIIKLAKQHGAKVIVDNTFATPMLWQPLNDGADIVIHSATKYMAGHGNLSAGVVSGNDPELAKQAIEYRKWVGHMLSPDEAYRLEDMLKTFNLRFTQHCSNAFAIAQYLDSHTMIEKVLYPGLPSHPTHANAIKMLENKGYGAIVTFDIKGKDWAEKETRCKRFIEILAHQIPLVPTLGDADTILMPIEAVWGDKFPFPGMIRLSVGIEDVTKLISSIKSALEQL